MDPLSNAAMIGDDECGMVEDSLLQILWASRGVESGIMTRGLNEERTSTARHRRTEMLLAAVIAILNSNLHRSVSLYCNVYLH